MENQTNIQALLNEYSSQFDYTKKYTSIILAAGHGKRIKSQTSKMLHKIWGRTTVERVLSACKKGLPDSNIIIVVGIKAEDVIKTLGKNESVIYAYQEEQLGTGHAVQTALGIIDSTKYKGTIFILPGDMGLIESSTIENLRKEYENSKADMMVLTGIFQGPVEENYYGRIVRAKSAKNKKDKSLQNVLEIIEYKDILSMKDKEKHVISYKNRLYRYSKKELLEIREFNSGVFVFDFKKLSKLVYKLNTANVQKEIYLTDLILLFNKQGYRVQAVSPKDQTEILGFNNKSVLKKMNAVARKRAYERIKDLIVIDDPDDFFLDEEILTQIEMMDSNGIPLDIQIGQGVYVAKGAKLNYNLTLMKNVYIDGNISFGKNVVIKDNVQLTCFSGQTMEIGNNVEIFSGDIIKGNVKIGDDVKIESGVRITGSDEYPTLIGKNVIIKGVTYIFGSEIEENFFVEHCVLVRKVLSKPPNFNGNIFTVRYYLPEAEGIEAIKNKQTP
ncbi:NTP transferase domain-containing protein [Melioribacteraceae bacterium 4301-Me]|uniref:NTP transferase domain-containing protein n=1 Tax=Pyranulibacter aquaticus TaxID=3163344 RepID=UPI003598A729